MGRDLEPRLASLLWSNTYADAIKVDVTIDTNKGRHMFPFEKSFKILVYIFDPGTYWEGVEERMRKVHSPWWKDAKKNCRSKDALLEGNIQPNGGASLQHFRFRVRKMVLRSAGFANT